MNNKVLICAFALLLSGAALAQQGTLTTSVEAEGGVYAEPILVTNKIEIYPNPAVEYLVIQIQNSTLNNVQFELHSIIGNEISISPEDLGDGRFRIPVKDHASGYYFLVIKDEFARFKQAYKFLKN